MSSEVKGFLSAKAKFEFSCGDLTDVIEVYGESGMPKSEDDWKVSLGLNAAIEVTEAYDMHIKDVRLALIVITLEEPTK